MNVLDSLKKRENKQVDAFKKGKQKEKKYESEEETHIVYTHGYIFILEKERNDNPRYFISSWIICGAYV